MGNNEVSYTYKGTPLEFLSHDDLLKCAKSAIKSAQQERDSHRESLAMEDMFARASVRPKVF